MSVDWSSRYRTGDTPWEKGEPHPEFPFLVSTHRELLAQSPQIFVPGCGFGHDAAVIASHPEVNVLGLDLAPEPLAEAHRLYPLENLSFEQGDLFEWRGEFDLVIEHTCFCAIPVDRRQDYVTAIDRLLKPDGSLLGIFFLDPDMEGEEGPPFGVTIEELHQFFDPYFELTWSAPPSKTFPSREGEDRELSMLWKKRIPPTST